MHKILGIGLFTAGAIMLGAAELDIINSGPVSQGRLPYLWSGPVGTIATAPFRQTDSTGNFVFDLGTDFGIRVGAYLALSGIFLSLYPIGEGVEYIYLIGILAGLALVLWTLYEN